MKTRIDGTLGFGELGSMDNVRVYLAKRLVVMGIQETACTHVGMEISESQDFAIEIAQKAVTGDS